MKNINPLHYIYLELNHVFQINLYHSFNCFKIEIKDMLLHRYY